MRDTYVAPEVDYCVCGQMLPDGPYLAEQAEEGELRYISLAHARCLNEFGYVADASTFGVHHRWCEDDGAD